MFGVSIHRNIILKYIESIIYIHRSENIFGPAIKAFRILTLGMIDSNNVLMILNSLESPRTSFRATIDKFIKLAIKIANESEEFEDELELYDDIIYHIYIYDIDYNIWIKKRGTSLSFNNSFYEENSENVEILHCLLTKHIMRKILIRKMQASDAFMRGLIKINGNLSDAIHARNLWKVFQTCMDHLSDEIE